MHHSTQWVHCHLLRVAEAWGEGELHHLRLHHNLSLVDEARAEEKPHRHQRLCRELLLVAEARDEGELHHLRLHSHLLLMDEAEGEEELHHLRPHRKLLLVAEATRGKVDLRHDYILYALVDHIIESRAKVATHM
ncbi:hypothetical protein CYMTET_18472 [Cymbomonas tetramitiformis]|uniref:Uncharacterized protein n=1 Tax=Cymbomonas tetramitiformis TaxID=36881 RepID=A0AAE0G7X7_9CHLO|nr:hypothetical protein CYMTET_18472 [Cymbomonas tetramitiformis]